MVKAGTQCNFFIDKGAWKIANRSATVTAAGATLEKGTFLTTQKHVRSLTGVEVAKLGAPLTEKKNRNYW